MLQVHQIEASYGKAQALFGMSFDVRKGEVTTLLGRNGMGKSTSVKSIMGLVRPTAGTITFKGARIDGLPSHAIAHLGIGLVPEGRHIFPNLSVRENLEMAFIKRADSREPWTLERVLAFFPRLQERINNGGNQLSGGEQQMLAISRALMTNPDLLILDEATEGLAPVIRDLIWERLSELKQTGLSMIVIDKEVDSLSSFADRHFIVEKGAVVWSGTSAELEANAQVRDEYLSV